MWELHLDAVSAPPRPDRPGVIVLGSEPTTIGRYATTVVLLSPKFPNLLSREHAVVWEDSAGDLWLRDTSLSGCRVDDRIIWQTEVRRAVPPGLTSADRLPRE